MFVFVELLVLFFVVEIYIDFVGFVVLKLVDREIYIFFVFVYCFDLECVCKKKGMDLNLKGFVIMRLWRGFYYDWYVELGRNFDFIFVVNVGIVVFLSWYFIFELIVFFNVLVFFIDYCEEVVVLVIEMIYYVIWGKYFDFEFFV